MKSQANCYSLRLQRVIVQAQYQLEIIEYE